MAKNLSLMGGETNKMNEIEELIFNKSFNDLKEELFHQIKMGSSLGGIICSTIIEFMEYEEQKTSGKITKTKEIVNSLSKPNGDLK